MAPNANPEPFHFLLANLFKREFKFMNSRPKGKTKIHDEKILSNKENWKNAIFGSLFVLLSILYSFMLDLERQIDNFTRSFWEEMPV